MTMYSICISMGSYYTLVIWKQSPCHRFGVLMVVLSCYAIRTITRQLKMVIFPFLVFTPFIKLSGCISKLLCIAPTIVKILTANNFSLSFICNISYYLIWCTFTSRTFKKWHITFLLGFFCRSSSTH